jgi:ectoine hydroxylase-related dioxygenase (phytanoyl-CoA dioxygenase family)
MLSQSQLTRFREQGYFILDPAVPEGMLEPLRKATRRVTAKARAGEWPHVRRAGDDDIWGVSHLLHPDLEEPIFAEYIASSVVLDVVADMLDVPQEEKEQKLQLELVNMLVNPGVRDHEIGWHRDLIREDVEPDEEVRRLSELQTAVQWNTPLYAESSLRIVPGSHTRAKTAEERDIVFNRPTDPMPDEKVVDLSPGEGVYYNANLLHRGVYPKSTHRETLHACMGLTEKALLRTHLYHSLGWMDTPGFKDRLPAPLHPLYDNFLQNKHTFDKNRK